MSITPSANASPIEPASDPFEGTDYRMLSLIDSGGMADVFIVEHRTLHLSYAAKLLRQSFASDKRTVDRMRLEAETLARLEHHNIVQIHAFHETKSGLPFIVMELLQGKTLRQALSEGGPGRISLPTALIFGLDLLNGLHAVHQLGIIHRDLKPSNLYIHCDQRNECVLKLLDFGGARVIPGISEDAPEPLAIPTRTGTLVGTPMFMSPEAAAGRPIDIRTDIYAAANMIYLMITGRGPFDDEGDIYAVLRAHATKQPPRLARFVSEGIPAALERAVARGLEKDPGRRFQSAREFGQALYDILRIYKTGGPVDTSVAKLTNVPAPTEQPRTQAESRHRLAKNLAQITLVLAILIAASGLGIVVIRQILGALP